MRYIQICEKGFTKLAQIILEADKSHYRLFKLSPWLSPSLEASEPREVRVSLSV